MFGFKRVLVLAPHTDDGEFGCGGTVARMLELGIEVHHVAFSAAEESLAAHHPKDLLRKEFAAASQALGLPEGNCRVLSYFVRKFPEQRQEILEDMVRLAQEIKPEAVFLPSSTDTHQDHQVIHNEGFRAFKRCTILGYEIPWNNLSFSTNSFVFLNERHLEKKIEAMQCYKSQSHRIYASREFLWSLARTRGVQIGCELAEVFEVMRWVIH